jgi:CRISPR/Cas system-associated exonuclease Cas4 (RecB family)
LSIRDEAMEVVHVGADPGKPSKCPEYCIYYDICNSEG